MLIAMSLPVAAMAQAGEFQGAWMEQGGSCRDVFVAAGKGLSFREGTNAFTPAFIVAGKQLRTPLASCTIKGTSRAGERRVLQLACTNAVASEDMKAIFVPRSAAELRRYTSLADTAGSSYKRCTRGDL